MPIALHHRPYPLQLRHPFGLATGSRTSTPCVLVRLHWNGCTGNGEASLPPYHGETVESVTTFLDQLDFSAFDNPFKLTDLLAHVDALAEGNHAAKAAIDIALHDLVSQARGIALSELLNVPNQLPPPTSFTIALGDPSTLPQKLEEAESFHIIKLKLGGTDDVAWLKQVTALTNKAIYADANQGWADRHQALDMAQMLQDLGFVLIEQPMPKNASMADMAWLRERSPLPIYGDEPVKRLTDLDWAQHCFHGVNIKLMKCTGLAEARKMIDRCRQLHLGVMLGCMTETSCATSAMAQLSPLADHVDLDGPHLIANNPYITQKLQNGRLMPHLGLGLGLTERAGIFGPWPE